MTYTVLDALFYEFKSVASQIWGVMSEDTRGAGCWKGLNGMRCVRYDK